MAYDGAIIVGSISIITLMIAKFKCYIKKNGMINWAIGCQDKPLIDDDEVEVKTTELGDVKVLYVRHKHHHNDSDDE